MPYQKKPWHKDDGIGTLMLAMLIFFLFVMALSVVCLQPADAEDGKVVVTVRDFGRGMTPVMPPYVNDPEAIVLSQNMYSTQPGSRQLRFGTVRIHPSTDTTVIDTDHGVDAMAHFVPSNDSGTLVYACGGKYYYTVTGQRLYREPVQGSPGAFEWKIDTSWISLYLTPPSEGVISVTTGSKVVTGTNTRFVRDILAGDSLITNPAGDAKVAYVISDTRLVVEDTFSSTVSPAWQVRRGYDTLTTPFMVQSGEILFMGAAGQPTQYVTYDSGQPFMHPLGVVDSFYIDAVRTLYDTSGGISRSSYDTLIGSGGAKMVHEIQVTSRRKNWEGDEWLQTWDETPRTYYVRLGHGRTGDPYKGKFYLIGGNDDTSLFLRTWYVDSLIKTGQSWADTVFNGWAGTPILSDTLLGDSIVGTWGYIYGATGTYTVVVSDTLTDTLTLLGRGGVCVLTGTDASLIDTSEFYKGMYFIHLTGTDVQWPAVKYGRFTQTRYVKQQWNPITQLPPPILSFPAGDTVVGFSEGCTKWNGSTCYQMTRNYVVHSYRYIPPEFLTEGTGWYPIRYAVFDTSGTDTLWIVTATSSALYDTTVVKTPNWELVRIGPPTFSGMVSWDREERMVGWGDTLNPGVLSFSESQNPLNWNASEDATMGAGALNPIINVVGYDDQLVVLRAHSMTSWPGNNELSLSDGLVGPRALVGLNKFLYWLDIDGVKRMARRDLSGYTIEKISADMDPVFNSWSATTFGPDVVPFKINPQVRDKAVLVHNQRDQHLYLFFAEGTSATNNKCLTYGLQTGKWDGYFTLAASDALWTTIRDTSRILMGSPDSAMFTGLDYSYSDVGGVGINGDLKGARFWVTDEQGWPTEAVLQRIRLLSRGVSGTFDSAFVIVTGGTKTDTMDLVYGGSYGNVEQIARFSGNNLSEFWNWEIKFFSDTLAGLFIPYQLQMEFAPVKRDD